MNKPLKDSLGLTPDQHEQFDSLPKDILDNLEALPEAAKALVGEVWRTAKAVGDTNFEGDLDDRMKALNNRHNVEMRWVVITGKMLDGRTADADTLAGAKEQVAELDAKSA